MNDLKKFGRKTALCTAGAALLTGLVCSAAAGPDPLFLAGLLTGTAAALINFLMLKGLGRAAAGLGSPAPVIAGYVAGMALYGAAFLACILKDTGCGAGCGAGLLALPAALVLVCAADAVKGTGGGEGEENGSRRTGDGHDRR